MCIRDSITKALAAVLQLGVTLDYSIFLWHSYKEAKEETPDDHQEAMAVAIGNTLTSVVGSSITTVAGFIALCFMSFTLGLDLGVVMAKGIDNNNAYPEIEQFLDESIQAAMQRFEGRKVKEDPDILPYREAFRSLNILSNIVLNELDWWVASQWENMPTHYEYKTRQNFSCAIK